jgi:hypothetical protein
MPSNERTAGRIIAQGFIIVCVLATSLASVWNGVQELPGSAGAVRLVAGFNVALGVGGLVGLWWFLRRHPLALHALAVWGILGVATAGTAAGVFTPPEQRTTAVAWSALSSAVLMGLIWFVAFRIVRARRDT